MRTEHEEASGFPLHAQYGYGHHNGQQLFTSPGRPVTG